MKIIQLWSIFTTTTFYNYAYAIVEDFREESIIEK